jgi:hypothetical protein
MKLKSTTNTEWTEINARIINTNYSFNGFDVAMKPTPLLSPPPKVLFCYEWTEINARIINTNYSFTGLDVAMKPTPCCLHLERFCFVTT